MAWPGNSGRNPCCTAKTTEEANFDSAQQQKGSPEFISNLSTNYSNITLATVVTCLALFVVESLIKICVDEKPT